MTERQLIAADGIRIKTVLLPALWAELKRMKSYNEMAECMAAIQLAQQIIEQLRIKYKNEKS